MVTRLADTRDTSTIQEAEHLMSEIRQLTCEREAIIALAEMDTAEITRKAQLETDPIEVKIEAASARLSTFIINNQHLFKKRRTHTTTDGNFGLREASRLIVNDADAALDYIFDRGYDDCMKVSRSLVKPAITKRIVNGEDFPGASVQKGDIAFCTVAKSMIRAAVDAAREQREEPSHGND